MIHAKTQGFAVMACKAAWFLQMLRYLGVCCLGV
jgi:hypothetical protein